MDATVYIALVHALQSDMSHEVDCSKFSVCWDPSAYEHGSHMRVMWTSHVDFDSFIFLCVYFGPPQKNEKVHHTTLCHFFALRKPFPAAATHHTGHHPVIWHRDVPPQECCTSGIPSAMPKDNFPASTFDSHLQSASFGDNIAN